MIRLFVGLSLPDPMAERLAGLVIGIPGARWIERRNLHITLRFIGDVENGLGRDIHDALAELYAPAPEIAITGFGTFGSRQPRALWAAVDKNPELIHLQNKIETAMLRLGLPPEPRKFTPHVTLARLKGAPVTRIQQFIAGHSPVRLGPEPAEGFTLFRSHLGRAGAEYEIVADYPLGLK